MPTYVYECKSCCDVFEVEQRITEDPLANCRCGSKGSLRRLIQPVGVVFNGPGFHINDYRSSQTDAAKTSEPKTESKPAADVAPCTPQGCPRCAE